MRDPGPALATFVVALVLVSSSPWAGGGVEALGTPPPRTAPALFPGGDVGAGLLLTRVYANSARDDEFVEITNLGSEARELVGWSLTDGEATATFPLDSILTPAGRLLVTRNSTSYVEDTLAIADFTWESGLVRRMEGGILRLADAGDEVRLLDPTHSTVDAYVWGNSDDPSPGWTGPPAEAMGRGEIAVRASNGLGGAADTDTAEDWAGVRHHRLGQSSFGLSTFEIRGRITPVLSPDAGDVPLLSFLASATHSLDLAVYTLTSERIGAALAGLAERGVHVRVLVDGAPVGGVEDDEKRILSGLVRAGADVRWLAGGTDVVKRYRYLHAKYAVADGRAAWIGSENFGAAGFPSGNGDGNRGWSAIIDDSEIARALAAVFDADFDSRRRDSIPVPLTSLDPLPPPPVVSPWSPSLERTVRPARLLIAPDNALDPGGLLDAMASAQDRMWIEAFYVDEAWRDAPNALVEAAFAAARRGVSVRIVLDGSWWSVGEGSSGNDRIVERLNGRARNESLDLEARLLEPRGRIERLHNKGLVIDGRTVLVSSMNWALGSATENREIGILVEDPDLAAFFEAAFAADWDGRPTSGVDARRLEDPAVLLGLYAFVAAASAISLRKLRVGSKGIKPRARLRTRASLGAHLRRGPGEVRVLPAELVAQPRARAGGRRRARGGREEARGRVRGPEGD